MFRKISVATDGSPLAGRAVETAADIAAKCGSELTVLHVLLHGDPPEALRQMAKIEHLIEDSPQPRIAVDNIPTQMMVAAADLDRHDLDHRVVMAIGEKIIEQAKGKAHKSGAASVKGEVLEGDYADEIISAVKRDGADLVVLGTRGHGLVEGLLMGSVSQKVAQEAGCACLVVR
ncbi:MAG: universal stress protein [Rhodospirillales bacterium]|nr:universal stress protein [Rhodospirillales bacterium]